MSLLRQSDYFEASKKNKVRVPRKGSHGGISTGKKIKLPTQHKSPNHKCSICSRKDAKKYSISEKESRWLCIECVNKYQNRESREVPNFIKASKLRVKS